MLEALWQELNSLDGLELVLPIDSRCLQQIDPLIRRNASSIDSDESLRRFLDWSSQSADHVFVIAPEIDNALVRITDRFRMPNQLIGPTAEVIRICSDKWNTFQFLTSKQIPTPPTRRCDDQAVGAIDFDVPWIVKPINGAGSLGVEFYDASRRKDLKKHGIRLDNVPASEFIVQQYVSGLASSIAIWRFPSQDLVFPAVEQVMESGTFKYVKSRGPLPEDMQKRARRLLELVVDNLPDFAGYLGVDLVLGSGSDPVDWVIEINPRFTTSFCETRKAVAKELQAQLQQFFFPRKNLSRLICRE